MNINNKYSRVFLPVILISTVLALISCYRKTDGISSKKTNSIVTSNDVQKSSICLRGTKVEGETKISFVMPPKSPLSLSPITSMSIDSGKSELYLLHRDKLIICDMISWKKLFEFKSEKCKWGYSSAVSANMRYFAAGFSSIFSCSSSIIYIFKVNDRELLGNIVVFDPKTLSGRGGIKFSDDGNYMVVNSPRVVLLYKVSDLSLYRTIRRSPNSIKAGGIHWLYGHCDFISPKDVIYNDKNEVFIVGIESGRKSKLKPVAETDTIVLIKKCIDRRNVLIALNSGKVIIISIETLEKTHEIKTEIHGRHEYISDLEICMDINAIFIGTTSGAIEARRLSDGNLLWRFPEESKEIPSGEISSTELINGSIKKKRIRVPIKQSVKFIQFVNNKVIWLAGGKYYECNIMNEMR